MKKYGMYFVGLAVLLLASLSIAAERHFGTVNAVDGKYQSIVIDDSVFPFALNMKVYDAKGREVNRYALKAGMEVSYEFQVGANGYNHITVISIGSRGLKSKEQGDD